MKKSDALRSYRNLILTFVLWGSLYVVSKIMLESLPLFVLAFFRFLIAYLFLLLVSVLREKRLVLRKNGPAAYNAVARNASAHGAMADSHSAYNAAARNASAHDAMADRNHSASAYEDTDTPDNASLRQLTRRYSLLLGIAGYAVFVGLQLIGTAYAGSTTASLINAINPVSITLMAALILGEQLTPAKIGGILLAITGVYLIVGTTDGVHPLGILCSIGSVIGWSYISVLMRKGLQVCDPLIVTRNALGIAAVCNLFFGIVQLALFEHAPVFPLSFPTIAGVFYMGICSTGIAYILWNKSLATLPASNCSAFYPLQPLTSAVLGVIFLHETLPRLFVPGTLLILGGILLCLFAPEHARTDVQA